MDAEMKYKHWPWKTRERFIQASDEQLAIWKAELDEYAEHNERVYSEKQHIYEDICAKVRMLYGSPSSQIKYMRRRDNKPQTPPHLLYEWDSAMRARTDHYKKIEEANKERELQRQRDEAIRQQAATIALISVEYGCEPTISGDDLIQHWRDTDKYFDLALAMYLTRGDWSEGFYRVSDALRRFNVETETDKAIHDDLLDCMGCDDGRVFRDTTWNYNRILSELVKPEIAADFQKLDDAGVYPA